MKRLTKKRCFFESQYFVHIFVCSNYIYALKGPVLVAGSHNKLDLPFGMNYKNT